MACVDEKGNVTASARTMLEAMSEALSAEDLAHRTGLPLYLVRSGLREMLSARLVEQREGKYQLAAGGRAALEKPG